MPNEGWGCSGQFGAEGGDRGLESRADRSLRVGRGDVVVDEEAPVGVEYAVGLEGAIGAVDRVAKAAELALPAAGAGVESKERGAGRREVVYQVDHAEAGVGVGEVGPQVLE